MFIQQCFVAALASCPLTFEQKNDSNLQKKMKKKDKTFH